MIMSSKITAGHALVQIQADLKCSKGQVNAFGKYKYRSCEDILAALKPHVFSQKCYVVFEDESIFEVGDRIYLKTTAVLKHPDSQTKVRATAQAREPKEKKGMSEDQVTGATSSYARKYALNALFAIDDTKDADFYDNGNSSVKKQAYKPKEATEEGTKSNKQSTVSKRCKKEDCSGEPVAHTMPSGEIRYFCKLCGVQCS